MGSEYLKLTYNVLYIHMSIYNFGRSFNTVRCYGRIGKLKLG